MKTLFLRGGMPKLQASADTVAFDGCAYTGGVMFPTCDDVPAGTPIVVDLDSIVIPSPVRPVLDDHDQSTDGVIGETSQLKVENYTLPVKGVLYPQKPRTKDKILSAKRHRWQLSIGLDNYRVEHIAAGRSVSVNQRVFHGPVAVIRNGYLTDLSFVAVGGDDLTWAKIAAGRARRIRAKQLSAGAGIMGFEQWCMDRFGIDAATLTAERFDLSEDSDRSEPLRAIGPEATGLVCPLVFGGLLVGTIAVGRRGGELLHGDLADALLVGGVELLHRLEGLARMEEGRGLHAFRHHAQTEAVRQCDGAAGDRQITGVAGDVAHEALVDF